MTKMKELGMEMTTWGAVIVTLLTFLLTAWWLFAVWRLLDQPPQIEDGVVVIDQFQRAKDILLVLLPLFSASVAYWLGSRETKEAKKDEDQAQRTLVALMDAAEPGLLSAAVERHPDYFQ